MPAALLNAYCVMLPRLEAQERLAGVTEVALGFGGGEEGKVALSELRAMARTGKAPERKRVTGQQFAVGMGIPVRVKKKKGVPHG